MGKRQPGEVLRHELFGGGASFRETFWALRHFDLSVEPGEAVGVIGQNGSGKSTLLQLIAGVFPPSEGSVLVEGKVAALLELGSGFDPEYTGRQNVYMYGALLGLSKEEIDARFDAIAAFADIGRFIDQQVRTYSSGMFVRLAFSVAIHVDANILIVDEALAVGDARFAAKCMKKIAQLRADGVTLFFVSHDISAVRTLCHRAVWLEKGRIVASGDVQEVTSRYTEHLFCDEGSEPQERAVDEGLEGGLVESSISGRLVADFNAALSRWGSHVGALSSASMQGFSGGIGVFFYGDEVRITVRVAVPQGVDASALSVAFSLKDLRGHDLHVCTTHDDYPGILAGIGGDIEVNFRFPMRLTPGKYMLVLALEDRSALKTHYYEYSEGCLFFEVVSDRPRFGVFNLPVEVSVVSL
jgi:lipopolysaccharide transport system ATP-binding protein